MTDDMKALCATIGHALLTFAGENAPAPQQEPEKPKKRYAQRPVRAAACIVCGAEYQTSSARAELCPHCRILRTNKNRAFLEQYRRAKLGIQSPDQEPQPEQPSGMVRCDRMHATIPATMCGTRGECMGYPLCPNLPQEP